MFCFSLTNVGSDFEKYYLDINYMEISGEVYIKWKNK